VHWTVGYPGTEVDYVLIIERPVGMAEHQGDIVRQILRWGFKVEVFLSCNLSRGGFEILLPFRNLHLSLSLGFHAFSTPVKTSVNSKPVDSHACFPYFQNSPREQELGKK
jgi:hypothetical protein